MDIYGKVPERFQNAADGFSRRGEISRISKPVMHEGRRYFEIVYNKGVLFTHRKEISGALLIDGDGSCVTDRESIRDLPNLFYYYQSFFGSLYTHLARAYNDEGGMEAEKDRYSEAVRGLKYLSEKNVPAAADAIPVLNGLLPMKEEANEVLGGLIGKISEYASAGAVYSDEAHRSLMESYDKVMRMNFQRIKLIGSKSSLYGGLKHDAGSMKKKISVRMDRGISDALLQLDTVLSFFISILNLYADMVHFSEDRYMNHIYMLDRQKIEALRAVLRNK